MTNVVADPLAVAPAPWRMKGEMWMIPWNAPNGVLPNDAYPASDRGTSYADQKINGVFKGVLGAIELVRYTETAVGPYDELMLIPGYFDSPGLGKSPRITTIYVSTEASVRNGRRNWAIPKYLANFSFEYSPRGSTHVTVTLPGASSPFFAANLIPARFVPSLPLSKYIPLPQLVQPPIPQPEDESSMFIGCPNWIGVKPSFGGWLRLVWTKGACEDGTYGDGEGFSAVAPSSWGFHLPNFDGVFPVGKVLEDKKTA